MGFVGGWSLLWVVFMLQVWYLVVCDLWVWFCWWVESGVGDVYVLETWGVFDLMRRCADRSVYDIKVPREHLESWLLHMPCNHSRGTLMSYTDRSAQRHIKSNTPIVLVECGFGLGWFFDVGVVFGGVCVVVLLVGGVWCGWCLCFGGVVCGLEVVLLIWVWLWV